MRSERGKGHETVPNFVAQTFETTEYDYDDAGNRQAVNRPGTSNDRSYTMDVGSGSTPHANRYRSDGVWTFEYDDEGNLLAKDRIASAERWEYTYDHRNHLVRAEHTTNGTTLDKWVEYVDDAHGNRVARIADLDGIGNGGASTVRYTLDGFNPSKPVPIGLENFDVWSENAADVSSSLITRYMHGDGVDELLGRWDAVGAGSGQFWILSDSLGSVRGVVEVGGTLVNQLTYDAFGTIVAETNPTYRGTFAFTGRFFDNALGLQTNGDRIYDPDLGRWLQNDPIGFAAGDGNLYRYVGNGATRRIDPSGLDLIDFMPLTSPPTISAPQPTTAIRLSPAEQQHFQDVLDSIVVPPGPPRATGTDRVIQRDVDEIVLAVAEIGALGLGFVPLVGDALDVRELIRGRDNVTDQPLGVGGWFLQLAATALPFVGGRMLRKAVGIGCDALNEGGQAVRRTTNTNRFIRNQHLAGHRHPRTNVLFDNDGFPIFDSMHDAPIPAALRGPGVTDANQFRNATEHLYRSVQQDPALRRRFTQQQLDAMAEGAERIPGYTWHHHQDGVTLQLVDSSIHAQTGHSGGRQLTGGRP